MKAKLITLRQIFLIEILIIIGLAAVPLFFSFPYRVNIFLSWEGAYRLYLGQVPFRDFGLPMGFAFWVIPALFFRIFGPYLITLVYSQVLINILAGLAFRSILKNLSVEPGIRLLSVLVFCLSYSFFNFWPWYDQSVIVFEIIALSFFLKFILNQNSRYRIYNLLAGCFFIFISFFTKQDGGGMGFAICLVLMAYNSYSEKNVKYFLLFLLFTGLIAAAVILPFLPYNFGYWFNYGQAPHNSRLSLYDIANEFFGASSWLKFYSFIIVILLFSSAKDIRSIIGDKKETIFLLLTLGILVEATIFQVTSYTPPDNNIFFHSFAFAFIIPHLNKRLKINFQKLKILLASCLLVMIWWSGVYWKYINRLVRRAFPETGQVSDKGVVSIDTYMVNNKADSTNSDMTTWVPSDLKVFKRIYMPSSVVKGIDGIMNLDMVRNKKNLKVLNMTELTPLAYQMHYKLEKGEDIPLWYHQGVGMFEQQTAGFCQKIKNNYYDLVLFEYIPDLNNFFPFQVRDSLKVYYQQIDKFEAPRRASVSDIEVYIRKSVSNDKSLITTEKDGR